MNKNDRYQQLKKYEEEKMKKLREYERDKKINYYERERIQKMKKYEKYKKNNRDTNNLDIDIYYMSFPYIYSCM